MDKNSIVITTKNEANNIAPLLNSICRQTIQPNEVIIVDAQSTDNTRQIIRSYKDKLNLRLITRKTNRSQGRNLAISQAKHELIAITDAGCVLEKNWLEQLVKIGAPASGLYQTKPKTKLQQVFALFLASSKKEILANPSSRSLLITKTIWKKAGGYPKHLNYCEDLVFNQKINFKPAPKAIAYWQLPNDLKNYLTKIKNYTQGNFQANYQPHLKRNYLTTIKFISLLPLLPLYPLLTLLKFKKLSLLPQLTLVQFLTDFIIAKTTIQSSNLAKGLSWMGFLRITGRLLNLIKTIILARLLTPQDFGDFAIVGLSLSFLETVTQTGINPALIQLQVKLKSYLNTAWVVSIIRGIFISSVMYLTAPVISQFFNAPQTTHFFRLLSLVPLIRGFLNPALISLQKELHFRREFKFRFVLLIVDTSVAITVALITRSALAFIIAMIATVSLELILSFIIFSDRPRLAFEPKKLKTVLNYGKWITLSGVFSFLTDQGDDGLVGKLLGSVSLGYYQLAYKISNLPFTEITNTIGIVTLPLYAKYQHQPKLLRQTFKKSLILNILFSGTITLIILLFTRPLVNFLLGSQWLPIVIPLKILSLFGLLRAVSSTATPLFLATNRPKLVTLIASSKFLILALIIYPLTVKYQIIGTSLAVLIAAILIQPLIWKKISPSLS
jgi:O-antigen/teichoic acid export membrane protein